MLLFSFCLLSLTSCSVFHNVGHRAGGDYIEAPENSLSCLKTALDKYQHLEHFVYLEIDIRETRDHELVVFHDASLKSLMKGAKTWNNIRLMNLNEIQTFRYQKNENEGIPTLKEFVDVAIAHNLQKPFVIEIKNVYSSQGMDKLCSIIDYYNKSYANHVSIDYVSSFDFPQKPVTLMSLIGNFPLPVKQDKVRWKKKLSDIDVAGIYKPIQHTVKLL